MTKKLTFTVRDPQIGMVIDRFRFIHTIGAKFVADLTTSSQVEVESVLLSQAAAADCAVVVDPEKIGEKCSRRSQRWNPRVHRQQESPEDALGKDSAVHVAVATEYSAAELRARSGSVGEGSSFELFGIQLRTLSGRNCYARPTLSTAESPSICHTELEAVLRSRVSAVF